MQEEERIIAGVREACLHRKRRLILPLSLPGPRLARSVDERGAEDRRRAGKRFREGLVISAVLVELPGDQGERPLARLAADELADPHLVGLGEEKIEADRERAMLFQEIDDGRELGSRPGPLPPIALQGFIIDVDDAHRRSRIIDARTQALIIVEDEILQIGPQGQRRETDQDGEQEGNGDGEPVKAKLLHRPILNSE